MQGPILAGAGALLPWKLANCSPAAVCSLHQACFLLEAWHSHHAGPQPDDVIAGQQHLCRSAHSWSSSGHQIPGQKPVSPLPAAPAPPSEPTSHLAHAHQHAHTAALPETHATSVSGPVISTHSTQHLRHPPLFPGLAWWQLPNMASQVAMQHDKLPARNNAGTQTSEASVHQQQQQQTNATNIQSQAPVTACQVLDGKGVATCWESEIAAQVREGTQRFGRPPGLAVVLVGNRPDSVLYVTRKQEACHRAGIHAEIHALPEDVSQSQLESAVRQLCANTTVDGVLVQLPLPPHLCEEQVVEQLDPRKDVDGFHPLNMGRMLMRGRAHRLVPCTALGVMQLLDRCKVNVRGLSAVVLGDSNIVGTPLAALLRDKGAAAVTVCHRNSYKEWYEADARGHLQRAAAHACLPRLPGPSSCGCHEDSVTTQEPASAVPQQDAALVQTAQEPAGGELPGDSSLGVGSTSCFQARHLPAVTRTADVLVVAVGVPELVRGHWVKPGAVVIDVGINVVSGTSTSTSTSTSSNASSSAAAALHYTPGNFTERSTSASTSGSTFEVVGDVHFGEVSQVAHYLTPVPGGVGPMTIAAVLHNTVKAAKYNNGLLDW